MTRVAPGASSRILIAIIVGLALMAAAQTTTPAQSPAPASGQSLPTFRVTTRLVLLDIVATDHKGVPLKDLSQDDFVIQEENQPQKIRVFNFQDALQQPETKPAPVVPPGRITNIPQFKSTGPLNVILIDGLNTNSKNLVYAKEEMLKMVEKLPPGQPIAIYALGSRLRLLQDFTTDSSLLKQALNKYRSKQAPNVDATSVASEPFLSAGISGALHEMGMEAMVQQITAFEQESATIQTDYRVELTLASLNSLARALSGYAGRKNLIWVSEVFPSYIFPLQNDRSLEQQARNSRRDYSAAIQQVTDALADAHVAVYPVDTRTVGNTDSYANLSNTDSQGNYLGRSATGRVAGGRSMTANEINRSVDDSLDSHSTMNAIADETGGRAFYNTNDLNGVIREGMRDGSAYYTLGYYPENKNWDGKFRRITVKVNRPGIKLRFRQGYYASNPTGYPQLSDRQRAMDFGRALNLEVPTSTALQFQAMMVPPSEQDAKAHINFAVDAHGINFDLMDDGLYHASVDCAVQVYSERREPVHIQGNTFTAALKTEQYQNVVQKFFPCNQTIDLPPGNYTLRLGVRDNHTGLIGTANAGLKMPAAAAAASATQEKKP
ncbi:MAG TPA: VWA domain-containing protein [Terriglobales bacterium]|nr:VWA domain-containing protein [Terriglobales bacterium]